jgi:hypothetical protein
VSGAEQSNSPSSHRFFLGLPITHFETEWNGEWSRRVAREGTVWDLLDTWDINDPNERSEIAQVLRHLRDAAFAAEKNERLRAELAAAIKQFHEQMHHSIALQRAIEHHRRGVAVPPEIAANCPYHARMLNEHLAQKEGGGA